MLVFNFTFIKNKYKQIKKEKLRNKKQKDFIYGDGAHEHRSPADGDKLTFNRTMSGVFAVILRLLVCNSTAVSDSSVQN